VTRINAAIRFFVYVAQADYSRMFAMGAHLMQSAGTAGDGVLDEGNKNRQFVNR
jgi:hypothetical protein